MRKSITLLLLLLGFGMGASAVKGQLMITEIMYNSPIDTLGAQDSLEFIEIYNYTDQPVDLANYSLSGGVFHTFVPWVLNPGEFFLVARIAQGFSARFPNLVADQLGGGNFSNGELIELRNPSNAIIDSVRYGSTAPWPIQANNGGYSITLCDFNSDNGVASSWSAANTPVPGMVIHGRQIFANPGSCCSYIDTNGPTIVSAAIVDPTHIAIEFSEEVSLPSTWLANFTGSPAVSAANRTSGNDSIILTLSTPLADGNFVTYHVNGVEDLFCNEMAQDSFTLVRNVSTPSLNICEILYDDPSQSDDLEFIEIYNFGPNSASLGGLVLSGVAQAVFPDISLPSGERVVCAKNGTVVTQAFGPFGPVFDWNSGSLPNGAGFLQISNTNNTILDSLTYDVVPFWPAGASGTGHSIALCTETLPNFEGSNWTRSTLGDFTNIYMGDSIFATPGNSNCKTVSVRDQVDGAISIFPNPFNGFFVVSSELDGLSTIVVTDVSGRVVSKIEVNSAETKLSLADSPSGVYFVQVIGVDGSTFTARKLLKF